MKCYRKSSWFLSLKWSVFITFQTEISDNTFLPIMLRLPDASGHDRCHVMRAQGCIIISQYDLAFLWMRYNTGLKVVAHGPYRSAAKVFIHADMTPDKGIHLHVQARLDVGILAVGECSDEQVDRDQFAGAHVYVMHGWAGPVDFRTFSGLVLEMVGEAVGDGEFGIAFIELGLAHGDLAVTFAAFDVFLMEKLEGYTYAFQFLMYMLVVRITVHGLVRELLRIEEAIDL